MREGRARTSRRVLPAALLTLALLSCDALTGTAPKPPSGPAGEVARHIAALVAPNADVTDQPFEELLAKLDLAKTHGSGADQIVDQIRKTRAAVAEARASARALGGRKVASLARSVGAFSIPHFAHQLAFGLDELTKKNQAYRYPLNPYTKTDSGDKTFTTTTLTVTEIFSGEGSKVTGTVRWSYSTITIETGTGATVVHITDERELIGTIDVCPGADGGVPATLKVTSTIVAQQPGATTTRKSNGSSEFQGKVDDQASLRSVTQKQKVESSSQSTSGDGGYRAEHGATWNAGANGFIGGLDIGSITGSVTTVGITSAADAARAAGWDVALDAYALEPSFQKAQDLWRRGRCVVVVAPDYNAETPINAEQQNESQHDEAVDPSSETKFSVNLKHRFAGGAMSAPITASLASGQKALEPSRLESSGSLTYKAPDEEDKKATAKLQSTSKRGIGTLILDFHTGGGLTLTITGEVRGNSSQLGTVRVLDTVRIGPVQFKKTMGDVWEGEGTWTADTSSYTTVAGTSDTCTGKENGKVTLMATLETRGDKKIWVIDPLMAIAEGQGSQECVSSLGDQTLRGVTIPGKRTYESTGDAAALFIGNLTTFTVPAEGGTVRLHGSQSGPGGSWTSDGSARAQTK